jgi:phospholipid/cholesterol/gamma-HCH transport system permease protein
MVPLLTLAANFCGIVTGWVATTLAEPISLRLFVERGFRMLTFNDFLPSTLMTAIFGLIIGLVACFQGMRAQREEPKEARV